MKSLIRKLAKSTRYQNLFSTAKDLKNIKIFDNEIDLTKIQNIFLSYLYFYDSLYRELENNKISKHLMDEELYEDSYVLYRREKNKQKESKEDNPSNVKLVVSNEIHFPKKEVKSNG